MLRFFALPLADIQTIAAVVGITISFIVWAVNQAATKGKQEDQKKRQAQAAARQRALQQQQQQQKKQAQQRGVPRASQEDEVDAFLRSAAQQQQQGAPAQRPPAPLPSTSRPPQSRRPPASPQRQQASGQQASRQRRKPATPQPRAPQASPQAGRSGQPLYDGLETSDFAASASSMGHLEGHEHDLEQHVHDVFDHDLGQLDDVLASRDLDTFGDSSLLDADLHPREAAAGQSKPDGGIEDDIAEMFRNPANIRNAIVMQEILRRPSL